MGGDIFGLVTGPLVATLKSAPPVWAGTAKYNNIIVISCRYYSIKCLNILTIFVVTNFYENIC